MATIGRLNAILSLNAKGFHGGLTKAGRGLRGFAGSARATMRRIGGYAGLAFGALAGGGLVLGLKSAADRMDLISKAADRLGTTTKALGGLGYAANLTGTSLEQITKGITFMQKALGEAKMGTGEAKQYFDALGLSVDELAAMDAAASFQRIAGGIAGMSTASERAAASAKIFGRAGVDLLNLIQAGPEALARWQQEAAALGYSFDRDAGAKAELLKDAMFRVRAAMQGVFNTAAVQLAPYLTALADKFVALGTAGTGMGDHVVTGFEWITKAIAKCADYLQFFEAAWHGMRAVASGAVEMILGALGDLISAFEWVLRKLNIIDSSFGQTVQELAQGFRDTRLEAETSMEAAFARFEQGETTRKVESFFADLRKKSDTAAEAIAKSAGARLGALAAAPEVAEAHGGFEQVIRAYANIGPGPAMANRMSPADQEAPRQTDLLEELLFAVKGQGLGPLAA